MKLELKHITPYLPYDIEVLDALNQKVKIIGLKNETYFIENGNTYAYGDIQDCKAILRPLSDLTKEIEFNGEKFVPIDWFERDSIADYFDGNIWVKFLFEDGKCDDLDLIPYGMIQKLLEWHFDVFNLIENNLAIDINILKS